jgi:hypothetical protein
VQQVMSNLQINSQNALKLLLKAVEQMPVERTCRCGSTLEHAVITEREKIPHEALAKVKLLVGKYLSQEVVK